MKIALVGAELEENLAIRYMHASLFQAGHDVQIIPFNDVQQVPQVVQHVAQWQPALVGMSMVFTARAKEFIRLATAMRQAGFMGHITAGGHFATLHAELLLRDAPAIDSVLHGEGEEAMVDLAEHVHELQQVQGMTCRRGQGIVFTGPRVAVQNLDDRGGVEGHLKPGVCADGNRHAKQGC